MNWKGCERKLLLPNLRCTTPICFPEGFWETIGYPVFRLSFGPGSYRIKSRIDVSDLTVNYVLC